MFSKWCIYYQTKAKELADNGKPIGKLSKCFNKNKNEICSQGRRILEEFPEPALDLDIKRICFEYCKPIKLILCKRIKKLELKCRTSDNGKHPPKIKKLDLRKLNEK